MYRLGSERLASSAKDRHSDPPCTSLATATVPQLMCVCVRARAHACAHACAWVCVCACLCVCVCVRARARECLACVAPPSVPCTGV